MNGRSFDVIVIGLGGIGAAVCDHLARRGRRVLGLEQFDIPHDQGSSHGSSRVIRLAYFENPCYVPLVRRAMQGWYELEQRFHERLLVLTGGLDIGRPNAPAILGVKRGLTENNISFEELDAAEITRRYAPIRPHADDVAIFQADSGFIIPERGTIAHIESAIQAGAECRAREAVTSWESRGGSVRVTTPRGTYEAAAMVVCGGAWLGQLVPELAGRLQVERQVQAWFRAGNMRPFAVGSFPVMIHHLDNAAYYALPHHGRPGVKICRHRGGITIDPDTADRNPTLADEDDIRGYISQHIPDANGPLLAMKVCMYTNTPDHHFILDRHPQHREVFIAGGFSGHGYKFAPVVGEAMADLVMRGRTDLPIAPFAISRFA